MEFLQLSRNLPQVELGIVKEFFKNFDPKTGTSVVEGKTIKITDELVRHVLHLPISDIAVEGETDPQFDPSEIFNNGDKALERGHGWRIADTKTPESREWFQFVQKRLVMKLSPTYLAQKLLVATLGTLESMLLNWAGYVERFSTYPHWDSGEAEEGQGDHLIMFQLSLDDHSIPSGTSTGEARLIWVNAQR